jgi:hypothetical protein
MGEESKTIDERDVLVLNVFRAPGVNPSALVMSKSDRGI